MWSCGVTRSAYSNVERNHMTWHLSSDNFSLTSFTSSLDSLKNSVPSLKNLASSSKHSKFSASLETTLRRLHGGLPEVVDVDGFCEGFIGTTASSEVYVSDSSQFVGPLSEAVGAWVGGTVPGWAGIKAAVSVTGLRGVTLIESE